MAQTMLYWVGRRVVDFVARTVLDLNLLYHEALPDGPRIIAPNHPTTMDPFIVTILSSEQIHVLVTESAFRAPLIGPYLKRSGHVPVVVGQGRAAFDAGLRLLEAGKTVAIFPEGALSPLARVSRPHTGVTRLAMASGAPVVPVGIALDPTRIHHVDTGVRAADGHPEMARLYHGGPYYLTVGAPMRVQGSVDDRAHVAAETQRIMRHIVRLSRMSQYRIEGTAIPQGAVETNAIGALSIPFEIPT